jgi:Glycosyl hydrolase family 20, catalytic domain/Glycosyl hydrolase family 20, domain 2
MEITLVPKPTRISAGKADQTTNLTGNWSIVSNINSTRFKTQCERLETRINHLSSNQDNTDEGNHIKFTKTFNQITESSKFQDHYPLGLIAPRFPLYILFSPERIKVDPSLIIKNLKWMTEWDAKSYQTAEEYHIICGKFIQITARSERAVFFGIQTLIQLIEQTENKIPYQTIQDRPQHNIRAVQIDLKENCPTKQYLIQQTQILAHYKINTLVVEWEDKYPFMGDLEILKHAAALTEEEKNEWLDFCHLNYIEVIPLIQGLGHLDYVMKHQKFEHLSEMHSLGLKNDREKKLKHYMMCPSSQEVKSFLSKMHLQIIEGMRDHKQSRMVHVGMDETYFLGRCDICVEKIKEDSETGKSRLFVHHLNWLSQFYFEMDKTPIVWGDVLVRHPQLIDELDKRLILNDWEYDMPLPLPKRNINERRQNIDPSGETIDWVRTWESMTETELKEKQPSSAPYLEKYWYGKNKSPNQKYPFQTFPNLTYFKDHGFKTFASAAVQCAVSRPVIVDYPNRFPNIMYTNVIAKNRDVTGTFLTSWTVRNSMWSNLQYGFILHAESAWNAEILNVAEFTPQFWKSFFFDSSSSETSEQILKLTAFFSLTGSLTDEYNQLLHIFSGNDWTKSGIIDKDLTMKAIIPQFSVFKTILEELQPQVKRNKQFYNSLLFVANYQVLIGNILKVIPKIENIAIDYSEDKENAIPDIEDIEELGRKLKEIQGHLDGIIPELNKIHNWSLQSEEIEINEKRRIVPIIDHIKKLDCVFSPFVKYFKTFVDGIVDMSLKRFTKL